MRNVVALAVLLCLVAAPALAADGQVPSATLKALGLSEMRVVSDVDGMQVRGMSSNAQATSLTFFSALLFDPVTGTSAAFSAVDFARATDENAGLNALSSATATTTLISATPLNLTVNVLAVQVYSGTVGPFVIIGNGTATSP